MKKLQLHSNIIAPATHWALPALLCGVALAGENGITTRESYLQGGLQVSSAVTVTDTSADGRYVVFHTSEAMLPEDANGEVDVYRLDRSTGALDCASRNIWGIVGDGTSRTARISDDGRYVVYQTTATNLIGLDFNGEWDILRMDFATGALMRVSAPVGSLGTGNESSSSADISADGRFVTFQSRATNLVAGDTNGHQDVFWLDCELDIMQRLSVGPFGQASGASWDASISADGMRVAFSSHASNLALQDFNGASDIFVKDVGAGIQLVSQTWTGQLANDDSHDPRISADGQRVAFQGSASNMLPGDTNGVSDIFCVDLTTGELELVSANSQGEYADGHSFECEISADGERVLFANNGDNLAGDQNGEIQMYVRDMARGKTWLVSRPSGALAMPDDGSSLGAINGDGSVAFFGSVATNLTPGDTNGVRDVFSRTLLPDPIVYCVSSTTSAGCTPTIDFSGHPSATLGTGFLVEGIKLPNNKPGILFYGLSGAAQVPFLGGAVCMQTPTFRSIPLHSGGNPVGEDCSGNYSINMNSFATGLLGGDVAPGLTQVGQQVQAQFWGRDPQGAVHDSFLTDALEYVVGP